MCCLVECSDDSMSTYYVVFNTENTLYYDMSTEYIATTATSSHFSSVVVAPSATPNVREMEDNAVVMSFNEISLDRVSRRGVQQQNCFVMRAI